MKNVKKLVSVAVALICVTTLWSQENTEMRYLLGNQSGKVHVSGFGSYILGFSSVDGSFAVYNGGGGAVLLNQTVYFGAYGTGLSTQHRRGEFSMQDPNGKDVTYKNLNTEFGHGGFWLGYIHKSYKPIHFGASTKLGWGSLGLSRERLNQSIDEHDYYNIVTDNVFVISPQLEVELNLLRWFKINAAAGYQFVSGIDKAYTNLDGKQVEYFAAKDFNQPVFNLSFVFGGFGGKR